jgi:hypothetical protein
MAIVSHANCCQPGHEYTAANAKFCISVLPSEAVKALAAFAKDNAETQGKFTIGDEKEHNVFMRPQVGTPFAVLGSISCPLADTVN